MIAGLSARGWNGRQPEAPAKPGMHKPEAVPTRAPTKPKPHLAVVGGVLLVRLLVGRDAAVRLAGLGGRRQRVPAAGQAEGQAGKHEQRKRQAGMHEQREGERQRVQGSSESRGG